MVTKTKKTGMIEQYAGEFKSATAMYFVNISGVKSADVTGLKKALKRVGADFFMVKNNMMKLAADNALGEGKLSDLIGQYGLVSAREDIVEPAKLIKDFMKIGGEGFSPAFAVLEGNVIEGSKIVQLADLPSKDQLRGMLAGTMVGVMRNFMGVVNGATRDFMNVVSQMSKK